MKIQTARSVSASVCILAAVVLIALAPVLGITAPPVAETLPPTVQPGGGGGGAPPMLIGAWNYTPDASVSKVRGIARAGFRYDNSVRDGKWGWDAPFDFSRVHIVLAVDGRDVSDAEAVVRLQALPVLDFVNTYHWGLYHSAPPPDFCREGIERTRDLIAGLRLRLKAAGLSEYRLNRLNIVHDFENPGPLSMNKFANPEGKHKDQPLASNTPHLATACYLIGDAFRACGWDQRDNALMMNYGTNHRDRQIDLGAAPFWRATCYHVPGSLSDGLFVTGYWTGGPHGCITEAEVMDVIRRAPAPIWLALEDHQPGLDRILRAAKESGKVRLVLLWGTESNYGHGDKHREVAKGGSRDWIKKQDAVIADAIGMRK